MSREVKEDDVLLLVCRQLMRSRRFVARMGYRPGRAGAMLLLYILGVILIDPSRKSHASVSCRLGVVPAQTTVMAQREMSR